MQSQKGKVSQSTPTSRKASAVPSRPAQKRSAPLVLDTQELRQVAGGTTTEGPYKTW